MADIPPCASCKHWDRVFDPKEMSLPNPDPSGHPWIFEPAPRTWGVCHRAALFGPAGTESRFYVSDASEYRAWLTTRDDFGCVSHEAGIYVEPADSE